MRIPRFAQCQFRLLHAEGAECEYACHRRPIDMFPAGRHVLFKKALQPQPSPQRQRDIDFAEVAYALDTNTCDVHLRPLGRVCCLVAFEQFRLSVGLALKQIGDVTPTGLLLFVETGELTDG